MSKLKSRQTHGSENKGITPLITMNGKEGLVYVENSLDILSPDGVIILLEALESLQLRQVIDRRPTQFRVRTSLRP